MMARAARTFHRPHSQNPPAAASLHRAPIRVAGVSSYQKPHQEAVAARGVIADRRAGQSERRQRTDSGPRAMAVARLLEAVGWKLVRFSDEKVEQWRCPDWHQDLLTSFGPDRGRPLSEISKGVMLALTHAGSGLAHFGVGSPNNNSIGKADPQIPSRREHEANLRTRHDDLWPRGKGYIALLRLAATRAQPNVVAPWPWVETRLCQTIGMRT
jgi:hypothetical protein